VITGRDDRFVNLSRIAWLYDAFERIWDNTLCRQDETCERIGTVVSVKEGIGAFVRVDFGNAKASMLLLRD